MVNEATTTERLASEAAEQFEVEQRKQAQLASVRVEENTKERQEKIAVLAEPGGIARADAPERVATRIDRLARYHSDIRPIEPSAIAAEEPAALAAAGIVLERIINTEDFLGVRYLEAGALAARAVGRVNILDARGRLAGYGSGSLVSPQLLLTNHHVLPDRETAGSSVIEFDYQDGLDGRPLKPTILRLDPESFFLADEELDFALVAVGAGADALARYGFNPLIAAEGKAIVGDFVTIVQHPRGEKKQVALRENRIVQVLDPQLHYEADTEPGSSGSPVFNDQWEIVALHHASVAAPDRDELGGIVNEGIRISRLVRFIREQQLSPPERALAEAIFAERVTVTPAPPPPPGDPGPVRPPGLQTLHLAGPIEITLGGGNGGNGGAGSAPAADEAITIDPDYTSRTGYDPGFLGGGALRVPLPTLPDELAAAAAVNSMATTEPRYLLDYHHFSVVLNQERRLAFFTAVNIDGNSSFRLRRERDRWIADPRVPKEAQTGEELYRDNPLDRGHLVRRLDPAWGSTRALAKRSNDDTFHFTNCTPQHEDFNQNKTTWAGLEDYILENADNRDLKVSVFTGPVLAADDDRFGGVQLPRQYWKVVAMAKQNGQLSATGYLLSQEQLVEGLEVAPEVFSYGAYKTYQVPVRRIEELTHLSFGSLREADPLEQQEAAVAAKEIERPEQLVL